MVGTRSFGEAYTQIGQYHTIMESRVYLTWYQSHALNLVVLIVCMLKGEAY